MDKLSSFAIAAVLALAGAACAQMETTPDSSTDTQSTPSSTSDTASSQGQDSGATSSADTTSSAGTASSADTSSADTSSSGGTLSTARPSSEAGPIAVGLQVQSSTGTSIGTVVDVISDSGAGSPSFIVISSAGETVAVPYSAVSSMMHNGAIVMDQSRLQGAPKVQQSQLRDPSSTDWQNQANQYWGSMRSATPESSPPTGGTDQG